MLPPCSMEYLSSILLLLKAWVCKMAQELPTQPSCAVHRDTGQRHIELCNLGVQMQSMGNEWSRRVDILKPDAFM